MRADTMEQPPNPFSPLLAALAMFPLGALAGLAALLRSEAELTRRAVMSATLNSALLSGAMAALIFWKFGDTQIWLASGISVLAGLGGNTAIGIMLQVFAVLVKRSANLPIDPLDRKDLK